MDSKVSEVLAPIELDDVEQDDTITDHSDADEDQDIDHQAQQPG